MKRTVRRLAVVAMALAPIAGLQGTAVAGAPGAAVVVGTATLPTFPCPTTCGGGAFTSTAVVGVHSVGTFDKVTASFGYTEGCTNGEPLTGTANGTITAWNGSTKVIEGGFNWSRNGLVAVLGGSVVGAAVFVPTPIPACGSSTSINATVAGVGVFA